MGNCNHTLLLAENRIEGKEEPIYTWDIDSNYDPSSILDFEFEYLKQDPKWPYKPHERLDPGYFEFITKYWPYEEELKNGTVPKPRETLLEADNSEIWPVCATPYSTFLVEQFCLFMLFAPEYVLTDHYVLELQFIQVWEESRDDILST